MPLVEQAAPPLTALKNDKNQQDSDKHQKDNFYERMLEAKRRKRVFLEQQRIKAEFGEFAPPPPPAPLSPTDIAINQIRERLLAEKKAKEGPTLQEKLTQAFDDIARKAQGL